MEGWIARRDVGADRPRLRVGLVEEHRGDGGRGSACHQGKGRSGAPGCACAARLRRMDADRPQDPCVARRRRPPDATTTSAATSRSARPRSSAASTACARRGTLRGFTAVVDHAALGGATEALIELFFAPGRLARRGRRDARGAPRGRRGVVASRASRTRSRACARATTPTSSASSATCSATGASCGPARRSSSARWSSAEHRPGGVVPGDAADAAAASRARPAEPDVGGGRSRRPSGRPPAASSANGHARSRWKMWPPGRRSSSSRSTGVLASRHGRPSASRQSSPRPARRGRRRASAAWPRRRPLARAVGVGAEEPRGQVQREAASASGRPRRAARGPGSTGPPASGSRARTGTRVGDPPGERGGVSGVELAGRLVDVEGAGERLARGRRPGRAGGAGGAGAG